VGRQSPGEHAHQAGLTITVAADDADPCTVIHADRDGVEDHLSGIFEMQGLSPEQVRHWHDPTGSAADPDPAAADKPQIGTGRRELAVCHDVLASGALSKQLDTGVWPWI
jgi:hypothetical protein